MTFCLNSVIIRPKNGSEIKYAIILLHGYGGDGKDISMLSLNWKRHMPNTVFICPNGHERCAMNPSGYQWFDLSKEEPSYILEQSIKAENVIKKFIEEVKLEFDLSNSSGNIVIQHTTNIYGKNYSVSKAYDFEIIMKNLVKKKKLNKVFNESQFYESFLT